MERRKTPWFLWTAAILLIFAIAYPLSSGPNELVFWCFYEYADGVPDWYRQSCEIAYGPLDWFKLSGPEWIAGPLTQYQLWWYELAFGGPRGSAGY